MPTIRVTTETLQLIRERASPMFSFAPTARRRDDGDWDLPVDDDVAYAIAMARLPGENDDDVVDAAGTGGDRSAAGLTLPHWHT